MAEGLEHGEGGLPIIGMAGQPPYVFRQAGLIGRAALPAGRMGFGHRQRDRVIDREGGLADRVANDAKALAHMVGDIEGSGQAMFTKGTGQRGDAGGRCGVKGGAAMISQAQLDPAIQSAFDKVPFAGLPRADAVDGCGAQDRGAGSLGGFQRHFAREIALAGGHQGLGFGQRVGIAGETVLAQLKAPTLVIGIDGGS